MVHGRRLIVFSASDPKASRLTAMTQDWGCLVTTCGTLDELRGRIEGGEFDMVLVESSNVLQRLIADGDPTGPLLETSLAEIEKRHVMRVLSAKKNNKTAAAKVLGIDTKTLYNKLKSYESGGRAARDAAAKPDGPATDRILGDRPLGPAPFNGRARTDSLR
jgi:DNA-binding protein Fis